MNIETGNQLAEQPAAPSSAAEIDPFMLDNFTREMKERQNLLLGCAGGITAAVIAATIWAAITAITKIQLGWMAVGVGYLVGIAVRQFGKGIDQVYGIVGAVLSLLGCLAGNLLTAAIFVSQSEAVPLFKVLFLFLAAPGIVVEVLQATFSLIDLLFYGLAIYEGYKFSFRRITEAELATLMKSSA